MKSRYYIAYGSNLSVEQMKYRTPDAQIVGTARLKGWRLLFRQFTTIVRDFSPLPSRQYYSTLCNGYKTFGFNGAPLVDALHEAKDYEPQLSAKSSR